MKRRNKGKPKATTKNFIEVEILGGIRKIAGLWVACMEYNYILPRVTRGKKK